MTGSTARGGAPLDRLALAVKRVLPKNLFARALIIIVAPVLLSQSILSYIFIDRHWELVTRRICYIVAGDIAYIVAELDLSPGGDNSRIYQLARNAMQLTISFEPKADLPPPTEIRFPILERVLRTELTKVVGLPVVIDTLSSPDNVLMSFDLGDGVLHVSVPLKRITTTTNELLFFWMVGLSVLLLTVAILFLRNQIRPIVRLTEAAEAFGKGQKADDFKPSGAREVRRAAAAFIAMRQRIERHLRQRTEMLAGISHDLRTPLTRMKLRLAMMGDGEDQEELTRDVVEVERMIEEFLAFARGQEGEQPAETDIAALIAEVAEDANAGHRTTPVEAPALAPLVVTLRRQAVKRCLVNLIDNAQRHAGHVRVSLAASARWVEMIVDDDGPGIPDDRREDAFRPFVRLDDARNPVDAGVGLGLAIARDVARSHGGDIFLEQSPLGGLRARIRLPV
ncbi:two-component sensor histidine kinase [Zavarzinia compransoris]|uniref:histidine kinase n=1 Tax=Zavarzinia compransoris TaxID=1264899 RepID=A0A317E1X4_9PROT|nr:two-component sensor histidine kinase [Zavarzinia compransoris]